MLQCVIEGCSSRSETQTSAFTENAIHFHRFPIAAPIRQTWMQAINKREVSAGARICSLHFKKENYYLTSRGFYKLIGGSVPQIKLPHVQDVQEDSSCDEGVRIVLPPEPDNCYGSPSQQPSTKEITPEIGMTVNVLGSTNIKHEDVKNDTKGSSSDEKISNVQPLGQNIIYQSQQNSTKLITQKIGTTDNVFGSTKYIKHGEVNGDTTNSSEDEKQQNINLPNQRQQTSSKEMTTDNVMGSSTIKPGVQKHKVKTLLERKLLKEVRRLQEQGKKRMQAISCLLEQNRRLLDRNGFLEQQLKNSEKVAQNVNNLVQQESIFFKFN